MASSCLPKRTLERHVHLQEPLGCPCGAGIRTAPAPKAIEQGPYVPGFLAHVATVKCCDSIPLHRQAKALARAGVPVTRGYTAVGAAQARINDLSLRVTSPSGVFYWGNNGLTASNVSTAGGVSNKVDTVENVFLTTPAAGTWTVEVIADEIVQDGNPATRVVDAVYGLVVSGGKIQ